MRRSPCSEVAGKVASGRLRTKRTLSGVGARCARSAPATAWTGRADNRWRATIGPPGWARSSMRWKLNSTSSAFSSRLGVNQAVRWNFTPGRSWKGPLRPSADTSQRLGQAGYQLRAWRHSPPGGSSACRPRRWWWSASCTAPRRNRPGQLSVQTLKWQPGSNGGEQQGRGGGRIAVPPKARQPRTKGGGDNRPRRRAVQGLPAGAKLPPFLGLCWLAGAEFLRLPGCSGIKLFSRGRSSGNAKHR